MRNFRETAAQRAGRNKDTLLRILEIPKHVKISRQIHGKLADDMWTTIPNQSSLLKTIVTMRMAACELRRWGIIEQFSRCLQSMSSDFSRRLDEVEDMSWSLLFQNMCKSREPIQQVLA